MEMTLRFFGVDGVLIQESEVQQMKAVPRIGESIVVRELLPPQFSDTCLVTNVIHGLPYSDEHQIYVECQVKQKNASVNRHNGPSQYGAGGSADACGPGGAGCSDIDCFPSTGSDGKSNRIYRK